MLRREHLLWLTLGAALTGWEVSGAVRAIMGTLNDVFESPEDRPFRRRYLVSFGLSIAVLLCILGAVLSVMVVGRVLSPGGVLDVLLLVGRWIAAVGLLSAAVALLLRFGPAHPPPLRWVSAGTTLVIAIWIGSSLLFGFYVSKVADYGSLFGNLALVFILFLYVNISSTAFVLGVQLDETLEEEVRNGRRVGRRRS